MWSVLGEITKLRNEAPAAIDYHNSNRYRLVVKENNGSRTAYYFSTPIYNLRTRKLVDAKFQSNGGANYITGSNANVTISRNILMENDEGSCTIELPQNPTLVSSQEIYCGNNSIFPTTNGVAMKCNVMGTDKTSFVVEIGQPFLNVWANNKCFALMKEQFRPFVVFSCIGSIDATGNVIAPSKMEYQRLTDKKYRITISSTSPLAQYVLFESNLYDSKLFQDTTVESMNSSSNNAFGGTGFIGNTSMYGEQWLYARLDFSKIPEIIDKRIQKAVLHMPKLNQSKEQFSVFRASARFCSFGSNWDNKTVAGALVADSSSDGNYLSVDITSLLVDPRTNTITKSEGMILKPKARGSGFSVIATGDSYLSPQIMEINFI